MKLATDEFNNTSASVRNDLTDKFVYTIDAVPVTYEIKEYRSSSNNIYFALILPIFHQLMKLF